MPFGSHMTVTTFAAPYARLCHGRRRRGVASSSMMRRPHDFVGILIAAAAGAAMSAMIDATSPFAWAAHRRFRATRPRRLAARRASCARRVRRPAIRLAAS